MYWIDTDPRAQAAHMGIIAQMVLDFQPLSLVNNKGPYFVREANYDAYKGCGSMIMVL